VAGLRDVNADAGERHRITRRLVRSYPAVGSEFVDRNALNDRVRFNETQSAGM